MRANKYTKLKAFTILELTIAMLIAAIVIAITYTSYSIISRSFIAFRQKSEETAIMARLDQLLRRDIGRADMVMGADNKITMNGTPEGAVIYELNDAYIIRRSSAVDTFKVAVSNYQMLFEGRPPDHLDNDEGDRIDEASFVVVSKSDSISYHYYKQYSSENLIKRNPNAIN